MPDFDLIAPVYERLARLVYGKSLRKAQFFFVNKIPEGARVLVIGGGTGWFLKELIASEKCKSIVYIEASAQMLQLSRKAISNVKTLTQIDFRHGTENTLLPDECFDVVITNFLLDLFKEQEAFLLMRKLSTVLVPEGIWLYSDFRLNPTFPNRLWQAGLVKAMYLFFRYISQVKVYELPNTSSLFHRLGFYCIHHKRFWKGFIVSEVFTRNRKT